MKKQSIEEYKNNLTKNLVKYRTESGLTQSKLAEKINYSDKSISKWERGEGTPDVGVLLQLCEIYSISLNDFFEDQSQKEILPKKKHRNKKLFISLLSGTLVFFIAAFAFAVLFMIPQTHSFAWMSFIYAIPVLGIVMTTFSSIWGKALYRIISTSIIIWGLLISLCLSLNMFKFIWILCAAGGFFQLLTIFWFIFYDKFKAKKKN